MRLSESFHEMRTRERKFTPSGPEKNLPNKIVSKIDNVSKKHSGFDETAFFNRKKKCQQKYYSHSNSKGLSRSDAFTRKLC